MQDRIRKALKGNQEIMLSLYDEHKEAVWSLCCALLLEEKEADHATAHVFKKMLEELAAGRISNEGEFTRLTIRKAVMECKALAVKKSNRSFRVPRNTDFAATVYDPAKMDLTGTMSQIVLKNLPTFHRFIYVLNTVCEYSADQISRIFATNVRAIENALDSEQVNVDKIVTVARRKKGELPGYTTQELHSDLLRGVSMGVPASVDAAVKQSTRSICEPIVKARRQKGNIILGATGIVAAVIVICLVVLSLGGGNHSDVDLDNADPDATETVVIEEGVTYYADIAIEDYGTITVKLDPEAAPETVANFVALAKDGFYDGLTFHRIIDGFMMQGGDPEGDGNGSSDKTIPGEFSANGYDNPLSHTAGAISMARGDDYDSASCQFFIVHTDDNVEDLDGEYACFGYVTEGMDIVDAICAAADPDAENGMIEAEDQPVITSITIREVEETEDATEGTDATDSTEAMDAADDSTDSTDSTEAVE